MTTLQMRDLSRTGHELGRTRLDGLPQVVTLGELAPDHEEDPGMAFGRIGFEAPLTDPSQAREAMIALVRATEDRP
ncbi:MAG: hypothetical protein R3343_11035 [Nitriliruptorales bacterium]|nr:hypothetical protein [Nitriliruptorales bacterium]